MRQHYLLSLVTFIIITILFVVLAPLWGLIFVIIFVDFILKTYYYIHRKVCRVKTLVERQIRGSVHNRKSSV